MEGYPYDSLDDIEDTFQQKLNNDKQKKLMKMSLEQIKKTSQLKKAKTEKKTGPPLEAQKKYVTENDSDDDFVIKKLNKWDLGNIIFI